MTAEDCARASRRLEAWFEGEGRVGAHYTLQVSSPGIERPVRFPEHWRKYQGRTVRLTARGVAGHPLAVILGMEGEQLVRFALPEGREAAVPLQDIKEALLMEQGPAETRREP